MIERQRGLKLHTGIIQNFPCDSNINFPPKNIHGGPEKTSPFTFLLLLLQCVFSNHTVNCKTNEMTELSLSVTLTANS